MSLISPSVGDSKNIFKWDNNFSWSYNGEVADSIKERVKKAGGDVTGDLRCSLSWFNGDDLDIHVIEPDGNIIYYGSKVSWKSKGKLDVDMNAGGIHSRTPVENITFPDKRKMFNGKYEVLVHNFSQREMKDVGFDVEIEYNGEIHSFHYDKAVKDRAFITVAEFNFDRDKNEIEFIKSKTLPQKTASKEEWGITTNNFQNVSVVMNSPNHWNDGSIGNKHYFFILENCKNDKEPRGFYNEFLNENLRDHRKVFEVLASKLKVQYSDNQLSGLGFSSTQRNHLICKVQGNFTRTIKIIF